MDLPLAADEIYLCSIANGYQHRVNSHPEAPLALLSPLLRCLCVFRIKFEYLRTMLAHPLTCMLLCRHKRFNYLSSFEYVTGQHLAPVTRYKICCGAAVKMLKKS
jgi:hypothetical protein